MSKGEGLSGYYRYMSRFGEYVWLQSRATLMFDSRTGKPSYIVCMNFVIKYVSVEISRNLDHFLPAVLFPVLKIGRCCEAEICTVLLLLR